jgi:hypothetical protein
MTAVAVGCSDLLGQILRCIGAWVLKALRRIEFTKNTGKRLASDRFTAFVHIESKPRISVRMIVRLQSPPLTWMHVPSRQLRCGHALPPVRRNSVDRADSNLNDETAAVSIKLKHQQIDIAPNSSEMRERTGEAMLPQHRNDDTLQLTIHYLTSVHWMIECMA